MVARFTLAGRDFPCIDSPIKHDFTFTPAISLFVECDSEAELEAAFGRLSDGGGCSCRSTTTVSAPGSAGSPTASGCPGN
jgi:predicted 3-demethylubiquinone-9 3-methyltransferase (glyoxalase superfamily)